MSTRKMQKILMFTLLGAGLSGFCVYKVGTDQRALKYLADLPPFRSPSRIAYVDAQIRKRARLANGLVHAGTMLLLGNIKTACAK